MENPRSVVGAINWCKLLNRAVVFLHFERELTAREKLFVSLPTQRPLSR